MCFFRFLLEHKRGGNVSVVRSSSLKLRAMVVVIMCSSRILEVILKPKLQPNETKHSLPQFINCVDSQKTRRKFLSGTLSV